MRTIELISFLALIGACGLIGCSQDMHVFKSTVDKPVTVAVVDPIRDLTLWEMDVPVNHKLKLDLDRKPELGAFYSNMRSAKKLSWRVYADKGFGPIESDKISLPGTPILLQVSFRPSDEVPATTDSEPASASEPETASESVTESAPADTPSVSETDDASETVDRASETVDRASETVDQASETVDQASETVDQASETVDQASETVDQASETVDQASETAEETENEAPIPLPGLE